MTQLTRYLQIVAKVAEFVGAAAALVLGILAKGNVVSTHDGKLAVVSALVAGAGHAITHTTEPAA